ncbi:hypothetical protein K469DRAFT_777001 [Zopfia rhizophila CBS 207.26]|uniref:Secreted protein n=1 Tax=Zopfia rhizophila CBS 207.26 TaxID=1314779 RepID=A0A6A6E2J8_9PEZI|nr:hypothetical protein K469DRAFT_777001 [Zopfia rhizophila CBS 207.26]
MTRMEFGKLLVCGAWSFLCNTKAPCFVCLVATDPAHDPIFPFPDVCKIFCDAGEGNKFVAGNGELWMALLIDDSLPYDPRCPSAMLVWKSRHLARIHISDIDGFHRSDALNHGRCQRDKTRKAWPTRTRIRDERTNAPATPSPADRLDQ